MNWFKLQSSDIDSLQRGRNGVAEVVDFIIRQPEYKTCPVALCFLISFLISQWQKWLCGGREEWEKLRSRIDIYTVVAQSPSHIWLCDPMNCRTPGLPVPHHLPEFAQVHVHCIGDAIQPSHPLMPFSPSALNLFQHHWLFQWDFSSDSAICIRWPKY